jgi:ATP-dependent Lhr-like helicase
VALFLREHGELWQSLRQPGETGDKPAISPAARRVHDALERRGASFLRELTDCDPDVADAMAELVAAGLASSDGFTGLRAIVRRAAGGPAGRDQVHGAGRWSLVGGSGVSLAGTMDRDRAVTAQAWSFLQRYGVVFRKLLAREANAAPWRDLARVYRRLEARGEIRGGRFVAGMSGEQFASPEAVERLREIRRSASDGKVVVIGAADPLNLAGIITTGDRVRAVAASRVAYRDGVPIAALEGDYLRPLVDVASMPADVATKLTGRRVPAVTSGYVGN